MATQISSPPSPPDSSQDSSSAVQSLQRMNAVSGKEPMMEYFSEEEIFDEDPDLADYFSDFDISDEDVIKICRSFASYLTSRRSKKRRKRNPPKGERKKTDFHAGVAYKTHKY